MQIDAVKYQLKILLTKFEKGVQMGIALKYGYTNPSIYFNAWLIDHDSKPIPLTVRSPSRTLCEIFKFSILSCLTALPSIYPRNRSAGLRGSGNP